MTNEQAINRLKHLTFEPTIDEWDEEALNMAIEALSNSQKQSESLIRTSDDDVSATDVIYRQDAIDMTVEILSDATTCMMPKDLWCEVVTERISTLPSAQRTGEWIERDSDGVWECNQCHKYSMIYKANYCPYCGAKMKNNGDD